VLFLSHVLRVADILQNIAERALPRNARQWRDLRRGDGAEKNAGGLGFAHPQEGLLSGRGALARQLTTLRLGGSVVILGTGS
jgi:hypothetical protein